MSLVRATISDARSPIIGGAIVPSFGPSVAPYVAPPYWTTLWTSQDTQAFEQTIQSPALDKVTNVIAKPGGGFIATPTADATVGVYSYDADLSAGEAWNLDQGTNTYFQSALSACGSNFVGISDEGTPRLYKADFATGTETWGTAINGGAVGSAMCATTTDGAHIFVTHSANALEYYNSAGVFQATVATAGGNTRSIAISGDQTTVIVVYDTEVVRGYTISGFNGASTPAWTLNLASGNTHNENAVGTDAILIPDEVATAGGGVWLTAGVTSVYVWHITSAGVIDVSMDVEPDVSPNEIYQITLGLAVDPATGNLWGVGGPTTSAITGLSLRNRVWCYQPNGTFVGVWCGAHVPSSIAFNGSYLYIGNSAGWVTKISVAGLLAAPTNALANDYSPFRTPPEPDGLGNLYTAGNTRDNKLDRFNIETGLVVNTTGEFWAGGGGWTPYSLAYDPHLDQVLMSNATVTGSGGGDKSFSPDLSTVNWTGPNASANGPRGLAVTSTNRVFTVAALQNRWQKYRATDGVEVMNSATGYEDIGSLEVGYSDIANVSGGRGVVGVAIPGTEIVVWVRKQSSPGPGLHAISAADEADQMVSEWTFASVYGDAADQNIGGSNPRQIAIHTSGHVLYVTGGRVYLVDETDGSWIAEYTCPQPHRGVGSNWYTVSFAIDPDTGDIYLLRAQDSSDKRECEIIRLTCDGASLVKHSFFSELDPGYTSPIWTTSLGDGTTRLSGTTHDGAHLAFSNGVLLIQSQFVGSANPPFSTRWAAYRMTATLEGA